MTTSAKSALHAARAAKARTTRAMVARHLSMKGQGVHGTPSMREVGRTASGAIIRRIENPPGVAMPSGTRAGTPQHAEHWPSPLKPNAKPRPEFSVTADGKPLSPKLAELIAARLRPIQKSAELERWEARLTGPKVKPADWPEGVPFYPGTTIDPAIAAAVVASEKAQR